MKPASPHACDAWQLLMQLFFAQRANLPTLAAELQLSPAQCHLLHLIEPGRPVPMGELADTLACDASNVTGVVDKLEARGLIARQGAEYDRRVKVLVVTEKGRDLRKKLFARAATPPAAIASLPQKTRDLLTEVLRALLAERATPLPAKASGES